MNLQDQYAIGLTALGWSEDKEGRSRFREFTHPMRESKIFLGTHGAFRIGSCASKSFDASATVICSKAKEAYLAVIQQAQGGAK